MNAPAIRLGRWQQAYLYTVGALLVLSGGLWLLFHYFVRIEGEFGPMLHPLEPWWLRVHGMAGAAFLIGFGSVLPGHVRRAWGAARNRVTGTIFFSVMLTLTVTGYLLYYVGSEAARDVLSLVHWSVGLGLPVLTAWHVWRGRIWRRLTVAESRAKSAGQRMHEARSTERQAARQASSGKN